MALNLGGIIRLTYNVKDATGAPTNASTITLTITQPDGTLAAGITVTNPPSQTGQYSYDFTPSQSGLHSVHWATTGPTTAEDDVFVAERPASLLISVDEAVAHLRAQGIITSDSDREQLQWLCMVASEAVEKDLGRVFVRRTVTETYDGNRGSIVLRSTPVISVTSVTESGTGLTSTDWFLDSNAGILYRGTSTSYLWWGWGRQNIVVTYVAGYLNPPRIIRKVALNAVQAMWQESQATFHPGLEDVSAEASVFTATGSLTQVERSAYDSLRMPGIA